MLRTREEKLLCEACCDGLFTSVALLLRLGARINVKDKEKRGAIDCARIRNDLPNRRLMSARTKCADLLLQEHAVRLDSSLRSLCVAACSARPSVSLSRLPQHLQDEVQAARRTIPLPPVPPKRVGAVQPNTAAPIASLPAAAERTTNPLPLPTAPGAPPESLKRRVVSLEALNAAAAPPSKRPRLSTHEGDGGSPSDEFSGVAVPASASQPSPNRQHGAEPAAKRQRVGENVEPREAHQSSVLPALQQPEAYAARLRAMGVADVVALLEGWGFDEEAETLREKKMNGRKLLAFLEEEDLLADILGDATTARLLVRKLRKLT
eukprot:TRINITY_DN6741_c0_g2_i5.p1 TRINITY_DN6741_c0_g2~~TRINITY_DN6741_c0_g2_i5.p1  ORF type:complete len:322 (+),score=69.76 TRINITY_DN6741_c0_g2_i5:802-1767(+)